MKIHTAKSAQLYTTSSICDMCNACYLLGKWKYQPFEATFEGLIDFYQEFLISYQK